MSGYQKKKEKKREKSFDCSCDLCTVSMLRVYQHGPGSVLFTLGAYNTNSPTHNR